MLTAAKGWVSIVEEKQGERKTPGGLILANADKSYTKIGTVHSGPEHLQGRKVVFNSIGAHLVDAEGTKVMVVKEEEIILVGDK